MRRSGSTWTGSSSSTGSPIRKSSGKGPGRDRARLSDRQDVPLSGPGVRRVVPSEGREGAAENGAGRGCAAHHPAVGGGDQPGAAQALLPEGGEALQGEARGDPGGDLGAVVQAEYRRCTRGAGLLHSRRA